MIEDPEETPEAKPNIPVEKIERISEFARNARREPAPPQPRIQSGGIRAQALKRLRR
jgi:hypothetical protein